MLCICQEYILCVCAWANALALQAEIMRSSVNLLFIFGLNLQNIHGNLFIQIKQRFDHLVVVIRGVFFHCHLHIQLYSGKRICTQPKNSKKKQTLCRFYPICKWAILMVILVLGKKQQQQQGRAANACAYKLLQYNERIFRKLSFSYARKKKQKWNSNKFVEIDQAISNRCKKNRIKPNSYFNRFNF